MKFFLSMTCFVLMSLALSANAQTDTANSGDNKPAANEDATGLTGDSPASDSAEAQESAEGEIDAEAGEAPSVLDQPLDGSTVESFQAGLDRVEQEASEKEYRQLMSSISFLLFYDLGAKRDKATLYARLDGKSPREIIGKVQQHRSGKN